VRYQRASASGLRQWRGAADDPIEAASLRTGGGRYPHRPSTTLSQDSAAVSAVQNQPTVRDPRCHLSRKRLWSAAVYAGSEAECCPIKQIDTLVIAHTLGKRAQAAAK